MSSVERATSQIPANKLYVNVVAIQSTIYDGAGVKAAWVTSVGALSTPGAVVLRDMGKSVYLPSDNTGAFQSTILRKIQLVPSGLNTTVNGVGGASTAGTEYFTGYISLGGQTYGGGNGVATGVARLN
jgi:hypothetical protein